MDHSIAGADHSIAGTEPGTPGMVHREGSRVSKRHVLVSPASPPQRSSLRQSEASSWHSPIWCGMHLERHPLPPSCITTIRPRPAGSQPARWPWWSISSGTTIGTPT